jgi:quercetin dioxygenase-like cupin family protein
MPVVRATESTDYEAHGSAFRSYVAPSRGGGQLCAWHLTVPAGQQGVAHRPTRDEVLLILDGTLHLTLDGTPSDVHAGDVAVVPAGSELRVEGGVRDATAWVTTTKGLEAVLADGTRLSPPWAN